MTPFFNDLKDKLDDWRAGFLNHKHPVRDGMVSSIPLLGPSIQSVIDTKEHNLPFALDRGAWVTHHPAYIGSSLGGLVGGALLAPQLLKMGPRGLQQAFHRADTQLLGRGVPRLVPGGLSAKMVGAVGGNMLASSAAQGLLSAEYTRKQASQTDSDTRRGRISAGMSTLLPQVFNKLYIKGAPLNDSGLSFDQESRVNDYLHNYAQQERVPIIGGGQIRANGAVQAFSPARPGAMSQMLSKVGPHYMATDKGLGRALKWSLLPWQVLKNKPPGVVNFGSMSAGNVPAHVLAHELGHHAQSPWLRGTVARQGMMLGNTLGAAAPIFSDSDSTARMGAGAGSLAALPGILGEIDASRRGAGMMEKALGTEAWSKLPMLRKLGPYVGVPTYLAAASTPWLAYGARKLSGGYKNASYDQDQMKRDAGTAALLGGSGLSFHTAGQMGKGLDLTNKLQVMHKNLLNNPSVYSDPFKSMDFLREYAENAGGAAKLRLFGVPMGNLMSIAPPSIISGENSKAGLGDVLYARLFGTSSLPSQEAQNLQHATQHYRGFVTNPQDVILRELATGRADMGEKALLPAARDLGLGSGDWRMLMDRHTKDPLLHLQEMVARRTPMSRYKMLSMTWPMMRKLTLGPQNVSLAQASRGMFDYAKALGVGPAAYGQGGRGFAGKVIPMALAAGAGLGAWGTARGINDHFKTASFLDQTKNWWDHDVQGKPNDWEMPASAASMALGANTMHNGWLKRPSDLIMVTGGRVTPPVNLIDIGAGHVTPARAIYEQLAKHPAVRSGEFTADMALREMNPRMDYSKFKTGFKFPWDVMRIFKNKKYQTPIVGSQGPGAHAGVTFDTGFGATHAIDYSGAWRSPSFTMNPDGIVGFLPDSADTINGGRRFLFGSKTPRHTAGLFTFGLPTPIAVDDSSPQSRIQGDGRFNRLAHYDAHPAIQDNVLDLASKRLSNPLTDKSRSAIWTTLAQKLEDAGDKGSADTLRQALAQKRKMLLLTGSSRGDFVAQRARELHKLLAKHPEMANKVQIVNMLGSSLDSDLTRKLLHGTSSMVNVGDTRKYFGNAQGSSSLFDLLNASDLHWGSTGASAFAEANLSRTPSGFVTHYNPWREKLKSFIGKHNIRLDENDRRALDIINLDQWNAGTLREIDQAAGKGGIFPARKASDMLRYLDAMSKGTAIADRTGEAQRYLEMARSGKADMIDKLVQHAREIRAQAPGRMMRRMGLGAAMLGAGGLGMADWMQKRKQYQDNRLPFLFH